MYKLAILLGLLLRSGGPCQPVNLSSAEQAWLRPSSAGRELRFQSNRGHTATLRPQPRKEWHENLNCNWLEAGRYQPIFAQVGWQLAQPYDPQRPGLSLTIRKSSPRRPALLLFSFAGLDCPDTTLPGQPGSKLRREVCTLASTGKTYPQAYVFRQGLNAINYGNRQLRAFHWDQQAGLLRYELADGEVFERVNP